MKRKINVRLIGMTVLAVAATLLCVTFLFYGLFQRQVQKDLRINAEILKDTGLFEQEYEDYSGDNLEQELELYFKDMHELRITWIDVDGTVLYDNDTSVAGLENHKDRPEIQEAFQDGSGASVRRSDTMDMNTFYYALLLDDGTVLRVAMEARNIFSMFMTVMPICIIIIGIIIFICIVLARLLTKQLLKPIEVMAQNMEDNSSTETYKELVPFMDTIRSQHENILAAAKSRQDFTANVSHELKTPLTAISGYAELIENHMVDPEQETHFATQIKANADRLVTLINDIIRLSELDNANAADQFERVDLYEIAESCVELLQVTARKKNIQLSLQGTSCMVHGNKNMIRELIDNLCQNAIRYNYEDGHVEVSVETWNEKPVICVKDTGIGIPSNQLSRVFERFYRVDKSRSRETGGTGLGLAIVKHIVELHDAEIYIESELKKGTRIWVEF